MTLAPSAAQSALDGMPGVDWRPVVAAHGFSWRKRALVRDFTGRVDVRFVIRGAEVPAGADLLLWGSAAIPDEVGDDVRIVRIEDGFLRSVGLGADLTRPISWVLDTRGIYYDARSTSDLEHILQTTSFTGVTLQRAFALRQSLGSSGLTKYNVGAKQWSRPSHTDHLDVVLVPGQVETDAAILYGAPGITTNLALLKAARKAQPDAWLIYKPHPDVVAGLRNPGSQEELAAQWCDEIVTDVSMGALLQEVDIVHVLTSLAGFEALIRGKQVVCHGLPFYAGWGLTQDVLPTPRRSRKLDIDQLVAGALLAYPAYVSRETGKLCQAEQALAELLAWRAHSSGELPFWRRALRPLIRHA